jgi:L-threonylcarbamoyladenylate synthase
MRDILNAAKGIQEGGVVAFPTETVYGLGADATNDTACQKIYALKSRPSTNPLIVHLDSLEQAKNFAKFSPQAVTLAEALWPGPISFVLSLQENSQIAPTVTAGLKTIAIRIPDNEIALELIKESGRPIAAPSANPSGYISPTTYQHVFEHFSKSNIIILRGDESVVGIESTILDLSQEQPTILRQGFITAEDIENIIKQKVITNQDESVLKAPGMMEKHYSPHAQVRLNATSIDEGEIGLGFGEIKFPLGMNLSEKGSLVEAAHNLYSHLRALDKIAQEKGYTAIAIAPIPYEKIGIALNDRLKRASAR